MIRSVLAACAQQVLRDAETNNISLISIIDEISVPTVPGMLGGIGVLFILERGNDDPTEQEGSLRVVLPDGKLQDFPVTINFSGKLRSRLILQMGGLPLLAPGILRFQLLVGPNRDQRLGEWAVTVTVISPPIASVRSA